MCRVFLMCALFTSKTCIKKKSDKCSLSWSIYTHSVIVFITFSFSSDTPDYPVAQCVCVCDGGGGVYWNQIWIYLSAYLFAFMYLVFTCSGPLSWQQHQVSSCLCSQSHCTPLPLAPCRPLSWWMTERWVHRPLCFLCQAYLCHSMSGVFLLLFLCILCA